MLENPGQELNNCDGTTASDFEICECKLFPTFVQCLEDTTQMVINAFIVPARDVPFPESFSICMAQSFRQFFLVNVSVRQKKPSKNNDRLPKLTSVAPSCVDLPNVSTIAVNPGNEPCVTLNGCNLDHTVAVVFNGQVCAKVLSASPTAIRVQVPCAVAVVGEVPSFPETVAPPSIPQQVSITLRDAFGNVSNALPLQIPCPVSSVNSL